MPISSQNALSCTYGRIFTLKMYILFQWWWFLLDMLSSGLLVLGEYHTKHQNLVVLCHLCFIFVYVQRHQNCKKSDTRQNYLCSVTGMHCWTSAPVILYRRLVQHSHVYDNCKEYSWFWFPKSKYTYLDHLASSYSSVVSHAR
jgi:hypothetical protein